MLHIFMGFRATFLPTYVWDKPNKPGSWPGVYQLLSQVFVQHRVHDYELQSPLCSGTAEPITYISLCVSIHHPAFLHACQLLLISILSSD